MGAAMGVAVGGVGEAEAEAVVAEAVVAAVGEEAAFVWAYSTSSPGGRTAAGSMRHARRYRHSTPDHTDNSQTRLPPPPPSRQQMQTLISKTLKKMPKKTSKKTMMKMPMPTQTPAPMQPPHDGEEGAG